MNYNSITTCDVCNGEDVGVVLWVSGCDVKCKGCHNKQTWDPNSGKLFDDDALQILDSELNKDEIKRLTISGGHPLMPCNRQDIKNIILWVRENHPDIKIWLYTGYDYKSMDKECKSICRMCDTVVDGQFVSKLADKSLPFRGSSNQNIIRFNHKNGKIKKNKSK